MPDNSALPALAQMLAQLGCYLDDEYPEETITLRCAWLRELHREVTMLLAPVAGEATPPDAREVLP